MHRAVSEHLLVLHQTIVELKRKVAENCLTAEERNRTETDIKAAGEAIDHYRKALELERRLGWNSA